MARRSRPSDPEGLRAELEALLREFADDLRSDNLRAKVRALIPAFRKLRDLGCSLVPRGAARSTSDAAIERILFYLKQYPLTVVTGDELMVVAGIQEWARRTRQLRRELGWRIISGVTVKEMDTEEGFSVDGVDLSAMRPDDYMLMSLEQDREAAHRWNVANRIRKSDASVRDKILEFLRNNVNQPVSGEELRYVAKDKTEWARRVRELRTEYGWPVVSKNSGRPDLPIGVYVLEADRQSPEHDRRIPDATRRAVLRSDGYRCRECEWNQDLWDRSDPRHLELHHIEHHADGGENVEGNLKTLCTVCHDDVHRRDEG